MLLLLLQVGWWRWGWLDSLLLLLLLLLVLFLLLLHHWWWWWWRRRRGWRGGPWGCRLEHILQEFVLLLLRA